MKLGLADLEYLTKVYEAINSDNPPEIPTICGDCDETAESDYDAHVALSTHIPQYWEERGDWGHPNTYEMSGDDSPLILIGCEGYHTLPQFSNAR